MYSEPGVAHSGRLRSSPATGAATAVAPSGCAAAVAGAAALVAALLSTGAAASPVAHGRGGCRPAGRRRAALRGSLARAARGHSMLGGDTDQTLSVREIYRLLKGAPSSTKALRLAARLRRAARDGRALKDGRTITVESVDEAMDAFLASMERQRASARGAMEPQEEERERPPLFKEPVRERQLPRSAWTDPLGEESSEDNELQEEPSSVETPRAVEVSDVPDEVRATIINNRYNYVDRVWASPNAGALPRAPDMHVDATLPEDAWLRLPHVAVNGMTNSGKSTLINHCLRWSYAAKASSRPGRTTSIDFYCVNNRFILVDLPGYPDPDEVAYMGVMKNWESHWEDLVLTYLEMCASRKYDLRLLLQLQLSRNRPSRMCTKFAAEVRRLDLPMLLIMTKDDQLKKGHEERNYYLRQITKSMNFEGPHLHYSSDANLLSSRKARRQLHRWIRSAVSAGSKEECKELLRKVWEGRDDTGAGAAAEPPEGHAAAQEALPVALAT